jgi:ADP-heptose:LPS heptosyltransferase
VILDTLGWRKTFDLFDNLARNPQGLGDLRQTRYDAALDFQGLWKSAVVAWLSRAQERIGFRERWIARAQRGSSLHSVGFRRRETSTWWKKTWRWSNGWERARTLAVSRCRGTTKMTRMWTRNLPR